MSDDESTDVTPEPEPDPDAVPITIDGKPFTARRGELLINAVERAGTYIPRFCYHPRMSSVGMCRQCLVEADTGRGPQITVSCMVTVAPDMKVETASPTTKRMQEGVLELLLINHPLDCPVCDKGGECPLQDQAYSHGPGESRYVDEKRHFEKPIAISDLVLLDRERCILCDRCTRFADEVAGDALIQFVDRGNQTQVMTYPDEPFTSYFSGNTVQICPVGALTATSYRFTARPWDLAESESTCTTCSVGCRITVQSSRDRLVRYLGVDSDTVNWSWMCDRGRFGFEAVGSPERLTVPLVRDGPRAADGSSERAPLTEASWTKALRTVADVLADTPSDRVAILGGARGSNEDAFAWAQLAGARGVAMRDAQLGDGLPAALLDLPRATIDETAAAATIVLCGPDPKEELPVLYLRLRHVLERRTAKLIELTPTQTGLSHNAWRGIRVEPGGAAAAKAALGADDIKAQLAAGPVVIVAGRANLAESAQSAAATVRAAYEAVTAAQSDVPDPPGVKVLPALRRGNVVGALQLGLRPADGGTDAMGILAAAADGRVDVLVLLGADPIADCPDTLLARTALEQVATVIALDTFLSDSSSRADIALPAAAFAETPGTTTNLEGRVTRLAARVTPKVTARPGWMVAAELADLLGHTDLADTLVSADAITAAISKAVPAYAGATLAALDGNVEGVLAVGPAGPAGIDVLDDFRVNPRNSYDYRLVVARKLYDRAVGTTHAPSLAPLGGDAAAHLHPADVDKLGAAPGAQVRLVAPRGTVVLPVAADPAVPRGLVLVPHNRGGEIGTLIDATGAAVDLRIEVVA